VTRTIGAAIGAVIFVLFMSYIAARLVGPVSAAPAHSQIAATQR
jgi:hypothetical protein